jgi:4-hydroxythreonine-4-phosphate dehydrogenase
MRYAFGATLHASIGWLDHMTSSLLALTMGDPCGIGPELIARWWAAAEGPRQALVLGCPEVMARACSQLPRGDQPAVRAVGGLDELADVPAGTMPVWAPPGLPAGLVALPPGRVAREAGQAAAACVRQAVVLARAGLVGGMVTAPLHKEALALAGEPYPGHTELLQAEGAAPGAPPLDVRMMLATDHLRTVLVTIHMSLRQAIEAVTFQAVLDTIRITHRSAPMWCDRVPRIAVAGLNPHAGEGGHFGREEIDIIAPAIQAARAEGIDVQGPFAPDTIFMRARHAPPEHPAEFDVVVAMYHDQGLIPVKYLGLDDGVNMTLGLPFVRTSPDHGTAFDLVGTGRADHRSFFAAVRMARRILQGRAPA